MLSVLIRRHYVGLARPPDGAPAQALTASRRLRGETLRGAASVRRKPPSHATDLRVADRQLSLGRPTLRKQIAHEDEIADVTKLVVDAVQVDATNSAGGEGCGCHVIGSFLVDEHSIDSPAENEVRVPYRFGKEPKPQLRVWGSGV